MKLHCITYTQVAVTFCCGLPCGIAAIMYDSNANTAVSSGNIAAAWELHKQAAQCRIASVVTGVVIIIFLIILQANGTSIWPGT